MTGESTNLKPEDEIIMTEAETNQAAKKTFFKGFQKGSMKRAKIVGGHASSYYSKSAAGVNSLLYNKVDGLNYGKNERDPKDLHDNLKVEFTDVIAEPAGTISFDPIWSASFKSYKSSRSFCYKFMTLVLGIPIALFWGLYFALLAFINIWCMVPAVKACTIQMGFIEKIWGMIIGTIFDPLFESVGHIFSNIRINNINNGQPIERV